MIRLRFVTREIQIFTTTTPVTDVLMIIITTARVIQIFFHTIERNSIGMMEIKGGDAHRGMC
jgi:hypothetical protein